MLLDSEKPATKQSTEFVITITLSPTSLLWHKSSLDTFVNFFQVRAVCLSQNEGILKPDIDAVPETGEPFQAIADDFQKLIMPGEFEAAHSCDHLVETITLSRHHSLAASLVLCLFPNRINVRGHHRGPVRQHCYITRFQCTGSDPGICVLILTSPLVVMQSGRNGTRSHHNGLGG